MEQERGKVLEDLRIDEKLFHLKDLITKKLHLPDPFIAELLSFENE